MSGTRLTVYEDVMHLEVDDHEVAVGDVIPTYRGNGPRDGERMGWAVVLSVKAVPGSAPELELELRAEETPR